jgi:hypothetical protein
MGTAKRTVRALGSPVRRYVNGSIESVKDEARRLHAEQEAAADRRHGEVLLAISRLEEAIGFLGLQLTNVRNELDDLRGAGAPPGRPDA